MGRTRKSLGVFAAGLLNAGCSGEIDDRGLSPAPGFSMRDELVCTMARSSTPGDVGGTISLLGLEGTDVRVVFESGTRSPMTKIYETDDTVVLQLTATATGSVDTLVIDKQSGKFSRATAGSLAGLYASAAVGTCV